MYKAKEILMLIFDEFVYGGHLLSLGAVSIVYTGSLLLNIRVTWDFLLIIYLGTESVYLYNRYIEFKNDLLGNPERTKHIKKHIKKIPSIILLFSLILFMIFIYNKNFLGFTFAIFLLLMGFLYSKVLKKITRKILGFKTFFVALMWSLLVLFLMIYYSISINLVFVLFFTFVFLRWSVNTSFFDIKDIEADRRERLKTWAVILGQDKLLQILRFITILAIFPLVFGIYLKILPIFCLMLFLTVPYSFFYFKQLENKKIKPAFLYNVIVDGEFILWPVFILLGDIIYTKLWIAFF